VPCNGVCARGHVAFTSGRSQRFFEEEAFGLTNLLDGLGRGRRRGREFVEDVRVVLRNGVCALHTWRSRAVGSPPILRGGSGLDELLDGFGAWPPARR
jgi:hypothetical protein